MPAPSRTGGGFTAALCDPMDDEDILILLPAGIRLLNFIAHQMLNRGIWLVIAPVVMGKRR